MCPHEVLNACGPIDSINPPANQTTYRPQNATIDPNYYFWPKTSPQANKRVLVTC